MIRNTLQATVGALALVLYQSTFGASTGSLPAQQWYRCNTHTHTSTPPRSDANQSLEFAAEWYRSHGYQCLVITDHEFLTDVAALNRKYAAGGDFLLLQGQEITQRLSDPAHPGGIRDLHVNGIGIDKAIMPIGYPTSPASGISPREAYERNISAIVAAGGIPQVNHPNLQWSVRLGDLLPIRQPFLFEVWNAFPTSNNLGGTDDLGQTSPSAEGLWDGLLSNGKLVWGVASDDTHDYLHLDDRESPTPGKAWIMVHAPALTPPDIMSSLRRGEFYATTGIILSSYRADDRGVSIQIAPSHEWSPALKPSARVITRFIGASGAVLREVSGHSAQYHFTGAEQYVRASMIDSDGRRAWTQPVFLDVRKANNSIASRSAP